MSGGSVPVCVCVCVCVCGGGEGASEDMVSLPLCLVSNRPGWSHHGGPIYTAMIVCAPLGNCLVHACKQVISIPGYFTYTSCIWTRKCTSLLKLVFKPEYATYPSCICLDHCCVQFAYALFAICVQLAHPWYTWTFTHIVHFLFLWVIIIAAHACTL